MKSSFFKYFVRITAISIIIILFLFIIIGNWSSFFRDRDNMPSELVKQCNNNFDNCIVPVDQVTDFEWDRIYVFREAIDDTLIQEVLGISFKSEHEGTRRKILFIKDNIIVHKELNYYDQFDGPPNNAIFFQYDKGEPPYYISRTKENAIFKIELTEGGEKTYYYLIPINTQQ